jgi:hypothetical protein
MCVVPAGLAVEVRWRVAPRAPGLVLADGCPLRGIAARDDIGEPQAHEVTPRNLLSMARWNGARSRLRPASCNLLLIAQMCLSRSGGLAPISLPLVQGWQSVPERDNERWSVMVNS